MRTWSAFFLLVLLLALNLAAQDDCGPGTTLGPPDPRYHDDKEIAAELLTLQNSYPGLALRVELQKTYSAPRTHEGRVIHALKISDNVSRDEDEPAILIVSNHHARELITPEIALDLGRCLLDGYGKDPAITARVNANEIWICPTFNPDGLAYVFSTNPMWRKNRRNNGGGAYGVDLNRNYPFMFGLCGYSTDPKSDLYQGPSAASEPETKTMIAFAEQERFAKVMDFHSYARDVRKPYGCNLCLPPVLCNYYISVQGTLASLAGYRKNNSCCGGGHFAYQVYRNGALSFLTETGTAFQPPYNEAVAEVARIRPMLDYFMDLAIPLSGNVRNRLTGEPVEADMDVAGIQYQFKEIRQSEPVFGRYHYFLPPGGFSVTFRAVGYLPVTRPVVIPATGGIVVNMDLDPSARITLRGSGRIGTTLFLDLSSTGDENALYLAGAALSTQPSQQILGRVFPLAPDPLFLASISVPEVFKNTVGTLNAGAMATASVAIPSEPAIAGVTVYFAFLTADTTPRVRSVSAPTKVILNK